jgi:hypothetical protein
VFEACNAHVPYCYPWPVRLYHILPHFPKNGTIFGGKNFVEHKTSVLSQQRTSETVLILEKLYIGLQVPVYLSGFNETWFSQQIFEKKKKNPSNIKFHENPPSGSRVIQWGRVDGQTDRLTVAFSTLRTRLKAWFGTMHSIKASVSSNHDTVRNCVQHYGISQF